MIDFAFDFAQPDDRRASRKPRRNGRTAMIDAGLPIGALGDWLDLVSSFLDMAKLATGTASLYRRDYLQRKLELYTQHDVDVFIGGNFLENIFARDGFDGAARLFGECRALGVAAIEVSETIVPIGLENRLALVKQALDAGLRVHAEVGAKLEASSVDDLLHEIATLTHFGVQHITIEGAELMTDGAPNEALCAHIAATFDRDQILFELCGPWLPRTQSWEAFALMRFLIDRFGPTVNIGNATPEFVVEIEAQRRGMNE